MKKLLQITFCVCLLVFQFSLAGNELSVHGFVDSSQGVSVKNPHSVISSRTRGRIESSMSSENAEAFVSVNVVQNGVVDDESGCNLNEAYINYYSDSLDVKVGKQIIIWGQADGFQINDIVSPKDYSEFLTRDFDDMRLGVDSLRCRYFGNFGTLEFVWIPIFTPSIVQYAGADSDDENPWATRIPDSIELGEEDLPSRDLGNSEYGFRYLRRASAFDLALSVFHTWYDLPVMTFSEGVLTPGYKRLTLYGAEFSMPLHDFVIRSEIAWYQGLYYSHENLLEGAEKKNSVHALAGLDWSPGGGWSLSAQLYDVSIVDYDEGLSDDEHTIYLTMQIARTFFRETLEISDMLFAGPRDGDMYNRIKGDYALTDSLHIALGADIFYGDDEGMFGTYEDNSQIFTKVVYSF